MRRSRPALLAALVAATAGGARADAPSGGTSPPVVRAVRIETEHPERLRPFVGLTVGQPLDGEGVRHAVELMFATGRFEDVPVELVRDASGRALLCSVTIGTTSVQFQGWKLNVGRSTLYLLDTDVPENAEHFRGLTALAYGGDMNTRIRQEIVLGIGGVRFLRAIGIAPSVFHMNEGHAAFLTLELLREELSRGVAKSAAEDRVRAQCKAMKSASLAASTSAANCRWLTSQACDRRPTGCVKPCSTGWGRT